MLVPLEFTLLALVRIHRPIIHCCIALVLLLAFSLPQPVAAHPDTQGLDTSSRPTLLDGETYGTEHFLLHYTTAEDSPNAVDATDADQSGVPDYIELVGDTLEESYDVEINQLGWAVPPSDGVLGGDERIDVYFQNILILGIAGYVSNAGGLVRDNPNTSEIERSAAFSFMALDNDYIEAADPELELLYTPTELMQATVAHELHHVIQMGYDSLDIHSWLYEASATWMEDQVYDDVNDGLYYLDEVFFSPDTCLVSANSTIGYGLRWYGSWLFLRHLSEEFGPQIVEDIWAQSRQLNGFEAIDVALESFGTTLEQESLTYATRNLLQAYEEGDLYPPVLFEGEARVGETFRPNTGVQSLGADYIKLPEEGLVSIELIDGNSNLSVRLVGIEADGDYTVVNAENNSIVSNLTLYDEAYLIVHNNQRVVEEQDCTYADYEIDIRTTREISTSPATSGTAQFYQQPVDEPILEGGPPPFIGATQGNNEFADRPEELEPSFEPIIPSNAPPGYAFDYGYLADPIDFGEDQQYYLPGGEEGVSFDYIDGSGNWLGIIQSPTPYFFLNEYVDARDLDIGEIELAELTTIGNYEVLIEDISNSTSPYYSATVILGELFIVVDGDDNREDVELMINNLIATFEGDVTAFFPDTAPPPPPPLPQPNAEVEPFGLGGGPSIPPSAAILRLGILSGGILLTTLCLVIGVLVISFSVSRQLALPTKRIPAEIAESQRRARAVAKAEPPDNNML